jgi:hypothetical protein
VRVLVTLLCLIVALVSTGNAQADSDRTCDGPVECCPTRVADRLPQHVEMKVGVVLLGLGGINERSGTFDADFYLYEQWPALAGFTPQTELVNEIERHNSQFDQTEYLGGSCLRTRRIRSTLRCDLNLRRFPFDSQAPSIVLSDDRFETSQLGYAASPYTLGIDDPVRHVASGWKLEGEPSFTRDSRPFRWEPGAPSYDYASVSFGVRRHVSYHLTRYFLPLFVIVFVAFTVFWIDPDDLNSEVGIGMTCLLAAIAFQFAEASTLPEVAYLTFADRVYTACYVAVALTMVQSLWSNALVRRNDRKAALRLDRRCRWVFPVGLLAAIVFAGIRAFAERT